MFKTLALITLLALSAYSQTLQKNSTLDATATDPVGATGEIACGIDHVQFYLDGLPIGPSISTQTTTDHYSFVWDSRTVTNGSHVMTAKATDKAGTGTVCDSTKPNTTTSAPITFTVNNVSPDITPPVITINPPLSGAVITSKQQPIQMAAADESSISNVTLKINGVVKATASNQGNLSMVWNTNPYKGTSVRIDAQATDVFGNTGTATSTVTVRK